MGLLKAIGGIAKNVGKALSIPFGIPMAVVGTILIKSAKGIVDLAATGTSYWIKNNFTGQTTLFGASTALTALSDTLGNWGKKWNSACFSGAKLVAGTTADFLEERLNQLGWASTGSYDNDPDKDDQEDRAIKAGKKKYEEHVKKLKEDKLAQLATRNDNLYTGESIFDKAKMATGEWLEAGRDIMSKIGNFSETQAKAMMKTWLDQAETNKSIKTVLHIIDVDAQHGFVGAIVNKGFQVGLSLKQAKSFFADKESAAYKNDEALEKIETLIKRADRALYSSMEPSKSPSKPKAKSMTPSSSRGGNDTSV